ncbi:MULTISPECIES: hypothetical protein [unclassified Mesorhizobium]|uniref:hypothetical protein n=1 Tax=unclassified Mesorhizobium TaxID=325217 RepID=UPI000FD45104|nr:MULTISPECIES: hypothetical protein [unclassified Mesorhizobium]RUV94481.1 hypothetical protein EOA88_05650 [Mesorhizobium sp. M5C.F.Ca.IN.020.14.1.1]RWG50015.1 MAG: hypothetical protein EOQ62_05170 [Mesorhizobium sp.]RWH50966.1 MAG: hypothetical protein EOQ80_02325 [Mesorhizobium sp.]RWH58976.1 MAG: hypothetical protein EOQ82_03745 [Mesorhizobium sp.]RWI66942.1 MAG: hypothetical protein EOR18_24410 [Mesorhizobium sp.]
MLQRSVAIGSCAPQDFGWGNIPSFLMAGDLKAYWNVIDGSNGETAENAYARGFKPVTILNPYSNFPKQKPR